MNKKAEKLTTASVLAFERKLDSSDALFSAGDWAARDQSEKWAPVLLREKSVRGTISNRLKTKDQDPAKLDAAIESPNLQTVDVAMLPAEADTLKVRFTLRVLSGTGEPSACNDAAYRQKLHQTVQTYVQQQGFTELARRYAHNLASGRFLWRNRAGAEAVSVQIARVQDGRAAKQWTFDALATPLRNFDAPTESKAALGELAQLVAQGLAGAEHVLLQVTAFVRAGAGQEVFPSQELVLDRGRGDKSKTLYAVENGAVKIAAMHSQKIGNALRTVDSWHAGVDEVGPIAAEPYGSVTTQGKAYRQPKEGQDFYSLLDDWVLRDKALTVEQQHFVIAILIRGGVFGDSGKE
jgi:CRISPR-associated protein Csy3